jgi:hypothetical protein
MPIVGPVVVVAVEVPVLGPVVPVGSVVPLVPTWVGHDIGVAIGIGHAIDLGVAGGKSALAVAVVRVRTPGRRWLSRRNS